ncbi:hypothetical protein LSH36_49g04016 [Paralvinella palmiformis]|uniref:Zinc finger CCCH-type with G patch domain-containing protein n=1 Tax=Paralvinella palmiformis TaxID=53620 RepID=A0AAD9K6L4_9ANNE|nr:hypothetical protein LSH36_49g04016 [Paralvinella palmiformis]
MLSQIEAALDIADNNKSLLSLKKSQLLSLVDQQIIQLTTTSGGISRADDGQYLDKEMAAFQAAIAEDDTSKDQQWVDSPEEPPLDEDAADLSEIIGTKCRAPYERDWGGYSYHNCMIISVESLEDSGEPKVRVMFCQPTHLSMLPCPYFLEDRCRFDDEKCSKLAVDTDCLVKDVDGVWYRAKVTDVRSDGQMYDVLFESSERTSTIDIADIIPCDSLGNDSDVEESQRDLPLSDNESDGDDDQLPVYLWRPNQSTSVLGEWENYTKGIGSRLMSKMGYVAGQGLGRECQGRVEPVPIQLLPQGKSLDKIMELKQIAGDQDLYDVLKKQKRKQKKVEKAAAESYEKNVNKHTVFDFINKKIGHKKVHVPPFPREPAVAAQMCRKLSNMEAHLTQLQSSQFTIQSHKQSRSDQKKLTIF